MKQSANQHSPIKNLTLNEGVEIIEASAFENTAISEIKIPDSVTAVGDKVFANCANLKTVTIGKGLKAVTKGMFENSPVTNLTLSEGIEAIGESAFENTAISEIKIPDSVTAVGDKAFANCANLKTVTIGKGLKAVTKGMFENSPVANLTLSEGIEAIGESAFENTAISEIKIPDSVTTVGDKAFANCANLKTVAIGKGVSAIGAGVFEGTAIEELTIPEGITSIGEKAFYNCDSLTSVTIPDSVTVIGNSAFDNCDKLKSVTLGNGVKAIGDNAFDNCKSLLSVKIYENVEEIGEKAFGYGFDKEYYDSDPLRIDGFKIYGYENTAAYDYAVKNSFIFVNFDTALVDKSTGVEVGGELFKEIPEDAQLSVEKTEIAEDVKCVGYKVALMLNGEEIAPNGEVTVKLPVTADNAGEKAEVYRQTENGLEKVDFTLENGFAVVKTDKLGTFAVKSLHNLTLHKGLEAACKADGEKDYYVCSVCGKCFEDEAATKEITNIDEWKVIPATGHNWVVSEDGSKRTCTVCGEVEILYTLGDVNGDGKVSAVDARWALQCAAKKRTLTYKEMKAADMNNDSKISAVDARLILKKAAGK